MSMDDQHRQLAAFHRHLQEVNARLQSSAAELASAHAYADPLWRDSWRQAYDRDYQPFAERLQIYLRHDAPNYERFLAEKTRALARYLRG